MTSFKIETPLNGKKHCVSRVHSFLEHSCTILSSFKIVIIFNNKSAEIKTRSAEVLLKMITILKELRIAQLCFKNERTLRSCLLRNKNLHKSSLKVRQSRNDFLNPTFLPKNERTNSTLLLWYLRLTCFRSFFWKKLKTPKRNFEVNWPLVKIF